MPLTDCRYPVDDNFVELNSIGVKLVHHAFEFNSIRVRIDVRGAQNSIRYAKAAVLSAVISGGIASFVEQFHFSLLHLNKPDRQRIQPAAVAFWTTSLIAKLGV